MTRNTEMARFLRVMSRARPSPSNVSSPTASTT